MARFRRTPQLHSLDIVKDMSPRLQRFFGVWQGLRSGPAIPLLSSVKVPLLGDLAAHCTITQRLTDTRTIYKYTGTQVERVYPYSLTGKAITDIVKPEIVAQLIKASNFTMDYPAGAYIREIITFKSDSKAYATTLTLPVADKDGSSTGMFSCVEYEGIDRPLGTPGQINMAAYRDLVFAHFLDLGTKGT